MSKHLKKEERRHQLLEAAMRAFGERGYHDTQVSHIIAQAKVARGTFYLYFQSKREIFDEIVTEISERVQKVIRPIQKDKLAEIPGQILGNIERATHLLLQNPLYIKIFFSDAVGLDKEFDERLRKFYQFVMTTIRTGLDQGQALGFVREGDTEILTLCLMGTLKEIFYQYVLGTYRGSPNKVVYEVFRVVLHAVIKPELIPTMLQEAADSSLSREAL